MASSAPEHLLRRHQALLRLYSTSTHRSNSVRSSIVFPTDQLVSQNDLAILRNQFQFIRDEEADAEEGETDWRVRMSVRYYQQLFREYALADLSRYKEGKIGLRWRTETEVVAGKGQFSCGNKHCDERTALRSYELLFTYIEHKKRKQCLVKVRACTLCAKKLFYKKIIARSSQDGYIKNEVRQRKRQRLVNMATNDATEIHDLCAKLHAEQMATSNLQATTIPAKKRDPQFDALFP
ncbi:hypothetical protein CCR75_001054 [Bremia lactucae]|uniref:Protein FRA10AC1 n=1 Tax=Bremia lactucae TaxID=4779 RepID=A0A976IHF3_BRELC|nr:hypothetical protein CCR75_001054 [Bremia lactucae]